VTASSAPWSSNDWPAIWTEQRFDDAVRPIKTVTVVVPAYGRQDALEGTLASLARQTYPSGLIDVVVADDGSDPPLDPTAPDGLSVKVVAQERDRFGLARARNTGAAQATGDIIAFVDADMVPEEVWVEAHALLHHLHPWLLAVGPRVHVTDRSVEARADFSSKRIREVFAGKEVFRPEWIYDYWATHDDGRVGSDNVWKVTSGGNLSVSRELFDAVGGFDRDSFTRYGGEDNDFGYRALQLGAYVLPAWRAVAWHLGHGTFARDDIDEILADARLVLASRIPDYGLPRVAGVHHVTPDLVIEIRAAGVSATDLVRVVGDTLCGMASLSIAFVVVGADPEVEVVLRQAVGTDPRIVIGWDAVPERWRFTPIVLESPPVAWPEAKLRRILISVREGRSAEMRIIVPEYDYPAVARLTRIVRQVERGMIDSTAVFSRFGGRWGSYDDLS